MIIQQIYDADVYAFTFRENNNQILQSDRLCVARNNSEIIANSNMRIRRIRSRCWEFDTKICRRASGVSHRE